MNGVICTGCGGESAYVQPRLCRRCNAARMREYRRKRPEVVQRHRREYYERNRDAVKATSQAYRDSNREVVRERDKVYAQTKRDRSAHSERGRRYYAANRERIRERHAAWRLQNPDAMSTYLAARRAKEREAKRWRVSPREWDRAVQRCGGLCSYCGERRPLERDHVIPLHRGGDHSVGNLLPACRSCNRAKGYKFLSEWRYKHGGTVRCA
jgi:5-methylcytosine-specific restriction endonuclease McrA